MHLNPNLHYKNQYHHHHPNLLNVNVLFRDFKTFLLLQVDAHYTPFQLHNRLLINVHIYR